MRSSSLLLSINVRRILVCKGGNFYKLAFSSTDSVTTLALATTSNDEAGFFRKLRLAFKIFAQNILPVTQLEEDNTAAYNATTLGDS